MRRTPLRVLLISGFLAATLGACRGEDGAGRASAAGGAGGNGASGNLGGAGGAAGGSGGTPTVCAPNVTEACDCSTGVLGVRRCAADGSGWGGCECEAYGVELSVSPSGSDTATGSRDAPFATLERAQDEVRSLVASGLPDGGIVVWLRGGVYERDATFELGAADSGTGSAPVVYRGYPGETVRLVGGRALEPSGFALVTSASPMWDRLDADARPNIVAIDLGAQGIGDYGTLAKRGFCGGASRSALELFVDGRPMTLARWPDGDANDPAPTETGDQLQLYGDSVPAVAGTYLKTGEQDGVSTFAREGLVDGEQYSLYRYHWQYQGTWNRAWFLTVQDGATAGYPSGAYPFWYRYAEGFGPLEPSAGGTGTLTFADPAAINHGFASIASADSDTAWHYTGDRPSRWATADEVWFHGYWQYMWADCHVPAASIDPTTRTVSFAEVPGYGIAAGQPYYAYNLLEELTQPGEYYLDRGTGILYLYPPSAGLGEVVISLLESPLVRLSETTNVELRDLTLEAGRGDLVSVAGGSDNVLDGVVLRSSGGNGATISGTRNGIRHCVVEGTGAGGIRLSGGERQALAASENFVENCAIHHFGRWEWTYRPGIDLAGVGARATNNDVHDAPHSAILYGGNEHRIERNDVHHVCQFSSDAGAIYAGRDWGARGNVIANNFVHHVSTFFTGYGVHGIYLDDCLSGIEVRGNVLYEVQDHAILHGGGRDDVMVGNVIAKCGDALAADARGFEWRPDRGPNDTPGDSWNLLEKLVNVGYQSEPWASRYPACAAIPNDWNAIIDPAATWLYPEGSVFSGNLGWQNGSFTNGATALGHYAGLADNVEDADPLFVDEANLDLTLQAGSPALAIPGFEPIPFGEIGVQE